MNFMEPLIMNPAESVWSRLVQYSMIRSVPSHYNLGPDCNKIFHGNNHQFHRILGLKYLTISIKTNLSNHKMVLLD